MEFPKKRLYCLLLQGGSSPDVVPGLAAATSPETCWDVNSMVLPGPAGSDTQGLGPSSLCYNQSCWRGSDAHTNLGGTALRVTISGCTYVLGVYRLTLKYDTPKSTSDYTSKMISKVEAEVENFTHSINAGSAHFWLLVTTVAWVPPEALAWDIPWICHSRVPRTALLMIQSLLQ